MVAMFLLIFNTIIQLKLQIKQLVSFLWREDIICTYHLGSLAAILNVNVFKNLAEEFPDAVSDQTRVATSDWHYCDCQVRYVLVEQ